MRTTIALTCLACTRYARRVQPALDNSDVPSSLSSLDIRTLWMKAGEKEAAEFGLREVAQEPLGLRNLYGRVGSKTRLRQASDHFVKLIHYMLRLRTVEERLTPDELATLLLNPDSITSHKQLLSLPRSKSPRLEEPLLNRKQRRYHLQPPGTPLPPPAQPATRFPPVEVGGILEDHAFEQFYYDEPTRSALLHLLDGYERPLLLCAPSLAYALEQASPTKAYRLLDRDKRFSFLNGFRHFELDRGADSEIAHFDGGLAPDVVLCDPPFTNFPIASLRTVIDTLAPNAPLFLGYNSKREEEVLEVFDGKGLVRLGPLGYPSVSRKLGKHLMLYGPAGVAFNHSRTSDA